MMDYITQLAAFQQAHDAAEAQESIDLSPDGRNLNELFSAYIPKPELLIHNFLFMRTASTCCQ